ncbi:hypothetical protein EDD16DRAFT_1773717 [Pisolithus croceorrhizus]|nr:hypothetical protein EDD16DRAFT_1773717 [Pisolithus croceorrhizus]
MLFAVWPLLEYIERDNVKHYKRAVKFCEGLAKLASNNGHNFLHIFKKDDQDFLGIGFNATFDVQTTKELTVPELVGHAVSAERRSTCVGETEIGIGKTSAECHHSTDINSCVLRSGYPGWMGSSARLPGFNLHLHITTIAHNFAEAGFPSIAASFDQEAAAVWMVFNGSPGETAFNSVSTNSDITLLLDTFFNILIFHREMVAQWKKAGYQDQEGYKNFRELLEAPVTNAQDLPLGSFPIPQYIVYDEGGSQAVGTQTN